jgi:anaphase-promoting complex subunit 8
LGLVCKQRGKLEDAKQHFFAALQMMPCLWSAWLELSSLLEFKDRIDYLDKLQDGHWIKNFFMASYYLDIHQENLSIIASQSLQKYFPTSVFLKNQIAHASYQAHQYDESIEQFK